MAARLRSIEQSLKSLEGSLKTSAGDMTAKLDHLLGREHSRRSGPHLPGPGELADRETVDRRLEVVERRLEDIDRKLNMVADAVGVRVQAKEEEDAEDRKRLKERLKEALALEKMDRVNGRRVDEVEDWPEFIFGICRPNGRVGKIGSRCAGAAPQHIAAGVGERADGWACPLQDDPPPVALHARLAATLRALSAAWHAAAG